MKPTSWTLRLRHGSVTGGALGARFQARPGGSRSTELSITSDDEALQFAVWIPFATPQRVARRVATWQDAARSVAMSRQDALTSGRWWELPDALVSAGWARTISLPGMRPQDGRWLQAHGGPKVCTLDLDRKGMTLRTWRRRVLIPWADVTSVSVETIAGAQGRLVVALADGTDLHFESRLLDEGEMSTALEPLFAETSRGGATDTDSPAPPEH
jgi:Bacterial PH domain